jgi:glyoxalase-like protein
LQATTELDHVFICAPAERSALQGLMDFGLVGIEAIHPGQGTANACFLFENAYLEILWRHDDRELSSAAVRPTGLRERLRWQETGACPFGIAIRRKPEQPAVEMDVQWAYAAPFLPPGATIPVLSPPDAPSAPIVFVSLVPDWQEYAAANRQLLVHCGRSRRLTGVHLWLRGSQVPSFVEALTSAGITAEMTEGHYHMELEWDGGSEQGSKDFRPSLPLSLRW